MVNWKKTKECYDKKGVELQYEQEFYKLNIFEANCKIPGQEEFYREVDYLIDVIIKLFNKKDGRQYLLTSGYAYSQNGLGDEQTCFVQYPEAHYDPEPRVDRKIDPANQAHLITKVIGEKSREMIYDLPFGPEELDRLIREQEATYDRIEQRKAKKDNPNIRPEDLAKIKSAINVKDKINYYVKYDGILQTGVLVPTFELMRDKNFNYLYEAQWQDDPQYEGLVEKVDRQIEMKTGEPTARDRGVKRFARRQTVEETVRGAIE